jgi:hypothetical protein
MPGDGMPTMTQGHPKNQRDSIHGWMGIHTSSRYFGPRHDHSRSLSTGKVELPAVWYSHPRPEYPERYLPVEYRGRAVGYSSIIIFGLREVFLGSAKDGSAGSLRRDESEV